MDTESLVYPVDKVVQIHFFSLTFFKLNLHTEEGQID